jgi:hypothetical protein
LNIKLNEKVNNKNEYNNKLNENNKLLCNINIEKITEKIKIQIIEKENKELKQEKSKTIKILNDLESKYKKELEVANINLKKIENDNDDKSAKIEKLNN